MPQPLDSHSLASADPLQSALISSVSGLSAQSVPSSPAVDMGLSGQRLFLDVCSGATRPLSQAALDVGMQVLPSILYVQVNLICSTMHMAVASRKLFEHGLVCLCQPAV